jgi:hypothetical protein
MAGELDLFDSLVFCVGLVVIMWVGLHSSWRARARALPPAAVISMIVWLAALGFAGYLIFG